MKIIMIRIRKPLICMLMVCLFVYAAFGAGNKEAASSSNRGRYLSDLGYIVPPEEILIESYISQVDYDYPLPSEESIGMYINTDTKDSLSYVQIGLKGQKIAFKDLPPFNVSFVIDKSGSMSSQDKMGWVKDSFDIFINNVREKDYVSLVVFDTNAKVVIPATQIKTYEEKQKFRQLVRSIAESGGTNVYDGLTLGYNEVILNYNKSYINRVILLTDGMHNSGGKTNADIINLAAKYNNLDINVSSIALGSSADINLVVDMAESGGGSSRFISDHEKMVETFGTELDRLLVPAARMIRISLELASGSMLNETWGYKNKLSGNTVTYELDTIHNGDYETILAELFTSSLNKEGQQLAVLSIEYVDSTGILVQKHNIPVMLNQEQIIDNNQISDTRVMRSEAYVVFGRKMMELGTTAQKIAKMQNEYEQLLNLNPSNLTQIDAYGEPIKLQKDSVSSALQMKQNIVTALESSLKIVEYLESYVTNVDNAVPGEQFKDDYVILKNYKTSFEKSLSSYRSENTVQE